MLITTITDQGLRILVEPLPHTHSVSMGYFVGVGACHETAQFSGMAHLIEHLCFKGTQSFPNPKLISDMIEGVGGILEASTSHESTIYWSKVADLYVDRAISLLTEMVRYPLFEAAEMAKEQQVICEEIRSYQDSPDEIAHLLLHESLWGAQPLGRDIAGSIETVSALTRQDVVDFWQQHYSQKDLVISVAGNIDPAQVIEAIKVAFTGHPAHDPLPPLPTKPARPGPEVVLLPKETEQGQFCLGFPALSYSDPDRRAAQVLNVIVGGGTSSRLFQEVREERGLAYEIGSYQNELVDSGMWVIYGGVRTNALRDSLRLILQILANVASKGVTVEELKRVKDQVKGGMLISLEDTWSVASRNGSHLLHYGEVVPVERVVEEIEAVTQEDVLRVAQRLLRRDSLHLAVVGPYQKKDKALLRSILEEF